MDWLRHAVEGQARRAAGPEQLVSASAPAKRVDRPEPSQETRRKLRAISDKSVGRSNEEEKLIYSSQRAENK